MTPRDNKEEICNVECPVHCYTRPQKDTYHVGGGGAYVASDLEWQGEKDVKIPHSALKHCPNCVFPPNYNCDCSCHKAEVGESWEQRFDELWKTLGHLIYPATNVKTFIERELASERAQVVKKLRELVLNAGKNNIPMLSPDRPRCDKCLNGFTGTYWISQNMLVFALTGKHLSELTEAPTQKEL